MAGLFVLVATAVHLSEPVNSREIQKRYIDTDRGVRRNLSDLQLFAAGQTYSAINDLRSNWRSRSSYDDVRTAISDARRDSDGICSLRIVALETTVPL